MRDLFKPGEAMPLDVAIAKAEAFLKYADDMDAMLRQLARGNPSLEAKLDGARAEAAKVEALLEKWKQQQADEQCMSCTRTAAIGAVVVSVVGLVGYAFWL